MLPSLKPSATQLTLAPSVVMDQSVDIALEYLPKNVVLRLLSLAHSRRAAEIRHAHTTRSQRLLLQAKQHMDPQLHGSTSSTSVGGVTSADDDLAISTTAIERFRAVILWVDLRGFIPSSEVPVGSLEHFVLFDKLVSPFRKCVTVLAMVSSPLAGNSRPLLVPCAILCPHTDAMLDQSSATFGRPCCGGHGRSRDSVVEQHVPGGRAGVVRSGSQVCS